MTETIFARPRHDYQSYSDYWKLVGLSGYPVIYIDEIDPDSTNTYIFTGPDASSEVGAGFRKGRARIIYHLLEWYTDYQKQPGVHEVWNSNETFAKHVGAKFVPMGSHARLAGELNTQTKDYDIVHLSYAIPRRQEVYTSLLQRNVKIAPNGWGAQRHETLLRSRIMLQVHQFPETPAYAPLRAAIAAAYKLALVIEDGWCITPLEQAAMVYEYGELAGALSVVCSPEHAEFVRQLGQRLHDRLCVENSFRSFVEAAL